MNEIHSQTEACEATSDVAPERASMADLTVSTPSDIKMQGQVSTITILCEPF